MRQAQQNALSVRRLARAFAEPVSTVGRWVAKAPRPVGGQKRGKGASPGRRSCPVSGDAELRARVRRLCLAPRHRTFGYRRIWALLRLKEGIRVNRKTVWRIMHEQGWVRKKISRRGQRPKRVRKMRPERANQAWQIDMTSFQLSDLRPVYLVLATDCFSREIVGWTLERRSRASEWVAAVRMGLEERGLDRTACEGLGLVLRSDNGSQPCSKVFVEYLSTRGVTGEYSGYNAPDDNAYVERTIRTVKEEEVWANAYETLSEARAAIDAYVRYYNRERPHSALDYQSPQEYAAAHVTLTAA